MQTTVREFVSQYRGTPKPTPVINRDRRQRVSRRTYDLFIELLDPNTTAEAATKVENWVSARFVIAEGVNA